MTVCLLKVSETTPANDADIYIPLAGVPEGLDEVKVPLPTGPTGLYWECRITISPHRRAETVTIMIDEFHDGDAPRNYYYRHQPERKPNGRERLHLPVALEQFPLEDGYKGCLAARRRCTDHLRQQHTWTLYPDDK